MASIISPNLGSNFATRSVTYSWSDSFFEADIDNYFLNPNPIVSKALRSFGNEPGPIPWICNISSSLNSDSRCNVFIPLFSNARLAGAAIIERKPIEGLFSFSQIGQVGQS